MDERLRQAEERMRALARQANADDATLERWDAAMILAELDRLRAIEAAAVKLIPDDEEWSSRRMDELDDEDGCRLTMLVSEMRALRAALAARKDGARRPPEWWKCRCDISCDLHKPDEMECVRCGARKDGAE